MKNFTFVLLALLLVFSGCRKEKPKPTDNDTPSITIKDGNGKSVEIISFKAWIVSDIINVQVVSSEGEVLYLYIDPVRSVEGKHGMNGASNWASLVDNARPADFLAVHRQDPEKSGFVSVDKVDLDKKLVTLRINLTLYDQSNTKKVTWEGTFANQTFSVEDPSNKANFTCKLGASPFNPDRVSLEKLPGVEEYYLWGLILSTNDLVSINFPSRLQNGAYGVEIFGEVRGTCTIAQKTYVAKDGYMIIEYYNPESKLLKGRFEFRAEDLDFNEIYVQEGSYTIKLK